MIVGIDLTKVGIGPLVIITITTLDVHLPISYMEMVGWGGHSTIS
jgi:acetaldehyde dehydrogenase (acetylating)